MCVWVCRLLACVALCVSAVSAHHTLPTAAWGSAQLACVQGSIRGVCLSFPPNFFTGRPDPAPGPVSIVASLSSDQLHPHVTGSHPYKGQGGFGCPQASQWGPRHRKGEASPARGLCPSPQWPAWREGLVRKTFTDTSHTDTTLLLPSGALRLRACFSGQFESSRGRQREDWPGQLFPCLLENSSFL